ncbi:hypothetical protein QF038_000873 [Pseudarthrobacter sp. W1I19]|uniref:hypothetical protein n=1 Tax=Pseudarthrobacter sp. W1I19 TaxID=3042288 RepID=UPI00278534BA|nr:hypothetical protein [Pseudarthrobacter sp. W1I19]MDQ0922365.1 hypothetical protein [Pseudarthrobacter sp. W1I19]
MASDNPLAAEEARSAEPPMAPPVPAPPKTRLVRPRPAQQARPIRNREHEVRRLILDLAALAAKHRPLAS